MKVFPEASLEKAVAGLNVETTDPMTGPSNAINEHSFLY